MNNKEYYANFKVFTHIVLLKFSFIVYLFQTISLFTLVTPK